MHSKPKMPKLFAVFLILSLTACATPKTTKFDGRWQFCEIVPQETLACLPEEDVKALRQLLIECQAKKP